MATISAMVQIVTDDTDGAAVQDAASATTFITARLKADDDGGPQVTDVQVKVDPTSQFDSADASAGGQAAPTNVPMTNGDMQALRKATPQGGGVAGGMGGRPLREQA